MSSTKRSVLTGLGGVATGVGLVALYYYFKSQSNRIVSAEDAEKWRNRSIVSVENLSIDDIMLLFDVALQMERKVVNSGGYSDLARNKILASIFYEPSTRTSCSFQAAMKRLGGGVLSITDIQSSSVSKGETLSDTMRCLAQYSDVICLRHPRKGAAMAAKEALVGDGIAVINAGDGSGEHPTQALLDLFTMFKCLNGRIDGSNVTFIGDLKYGRTVHSLIPALAKFADITINLVSPKSLQCPIEVIGNVRSQSVKINVCNELTDAIITNTDVLYMTRVQKERFESEAEYNKVKGSFIINNAILDRCKYTAILMHPLPRVDEINVDCDSNHRSQYFNEMKYGMYVRMALLSLVLGLV